MGERLRSLGSLLLALLMMSITLGARASEDESDEKDGAEAADTHAPPGCNGCARSLHRHCATSVPPRQPGQPRYVATRLRRGSSTFVERLPAPKALQVELYRCEGLGAHDLVAAMSGQ